MQISFFKNEWVVEKIPMSVTSMCLLMITAYLRLFLEYIDAKKSFVLKGLFAYQLSICPRRCTVSLKKSGNVNGS